MHVQVLFALLSGNSSDDEGARDLTLCYLLLTGYDFDGLSLADEDAGDEWQGAADEHEAGDDVEGGFIVHAGYEQGTDDAPGAPGSEHNAVDGAGVLWPEEVGGKGWHGAESSTIAEADDGCWDEEEGKVADKGH
ncbi:MAG: hypothetical protein PVSMB5_27850 [Ktedonobacteraceae bacterium]